MIHQRNALNALIKLNRLSKDINVDFNTFATIVLYTLAAAAQAVENMPPALQVQFKLAVVQSLDEVTREAGEHENHAAWKLLESIGLLDLPIRENYEAYVETHNN